MVVLFSLSGSAVCCGMVVATHDFRLIINISSSIIISIAILVCFAIINGEKNKIDHR